jgi:hypothetical protein
MAQIAGACRFVYNLALEQRRDFYRPGRKINFASQCRQCGLKINADTNAAINLVRRADCALKPVEGHRTERPDEAGTIQRAA